MKFFVLRDIGNELLMMFFLTNSFDELNLINLKVAYAKLGAFGKIVTIIYFPNYFIANSSLNIQTFSPDKFIQYYRDLTIITKNKLLEISPLPRIYLKRHILGSSLRVFEACC